MRILVVEDDPDIMEFLVVHLEAECFAVDFAKDGKKGSELGRTNDYDLIVLDYNLPGKTGIEICKEVRAAGRISPILMLSVRNDTETKVELLNCGADDYMTKPFSFDELRARISALLRRPPVLQNESKLAVDDLFMDAVKHTVRRGKRLIYLTRKEFALLEYLLRNKGKLVSRASIMEHVWNEQGDPFSNTIEAHILNLRKKIEQPKKRPLIHNVPGRGYKIDFEPE